MQTNNFLLWGGSKTLMGYNKHFVNNTFVFADYSPAANGARRLGLTPPPGPLGNGYGSCASSIASYPFIAMGKAGLQEQWWNNTCIASSADAFFDWCACQRPNGRCPLGPPPPAHTSPPYLLFPSLTADECNSTHILDGTIPNPMKGNRYMSSNGDYVMRCKGDALNFSQAQALGVDLGSTVSTLPSVDALVAMGHDVLQF